MNAKSFARTVERVQRRLNEMGLDPNLEARDANGRVLYTAFDPRVKVDYSPQLARRSQTVTTQELATAAEQGVRALGNAQFQITRFLGDNGFLCTVSVRQGDYSGRPMPSPSAVQTAMQMGLRTVLASAVVDIMDFDEMMEAGPNSTRRRVHLRIKRGPTVSDVQ